jgi:hypothetical protein
MRRPRACRTTTKSWCCSPCSRNKSRALLKPKRRRRGPPPPVPAPLHRRPRAHKATGAGKHLFVTLNGQRHDVLVETLEAADAVYELH